MTSSMLQYYLSHLYMQFENNYYQIRLLRRKINEIVCLWITWFLRSMNQSQTPIFVEAMCTLLLGIQETLVPVFLVCVYSNTSFHVYEILNRYIYRINSFKIHWLTAHVWQIGHLFYPCSFTVLDAPNMEFLFGLDMLRKHQVIAWIVFELDHLIWLITPHAFSLSYPVHDWPKRQCS